MPEGQLPAPQIRSVRGSPPGFSRKRSRVMLNPVRHPTRPTAGRSSRRQVIRGALRSRAMARSRLSSKRAYGQWSELQPAHGGQPGPAGHADPYAPQFEPYVPPAYSHQQAAPAYGAQPAPQWPGRGADPRGFDVGGYAAPSHAPQAMPQPAHGAAAFGGQQYHESELSSADWAGQPGGFGHEPYQQGHGAELGFAQPEGGELDAAYGEEDVEYEDEEPPRGRRPMMIAAALVGAILVGGGVAYGYKKFASLDPQGDPPIIKSEAFPSKIKPADAGGKQFPYSDSKIMGRLGDGTSSAPDSNSAASPAPDTSSGASAAPSTDDGGTRKVATLVVGRDGTIQPPPVAPASDPPSSQVGVPGTSLVDVFGGQGASRSAFGAGQEQFRFDEADIEARHGGRYAFAAKEDDDYAGEDRQNQFRRQLEDVGGHDRQHRRARRRRGACSASSKKTQESRTCRDDSVGR